MEFLYWKILHKHTRIKRIYNGIASIVWDGNTIYIENFGTIGSYAHETVHAIQRERGFIIFKEGKAFANMLELFEIEKRSLSNRIFYNKRINSIFRNINTY